MVTNPFGAYATTNAAGSFNTESTGYVQGCALDNPAAKQFLSAGVLARTETLPMWGGIAISENLSGAVQSPPLPSGQLGNQIVRATSITTGVSGGITGFSVFDENLAAVNSPANPVPLVYSDGQVNFYRFGSNARIPVNVDPNLVDLAGNVITTNLSWDFVNQVLVPYSTATVSSGTYATAATISSGTYTTGTGAVSLTTNAAHGLVVGDTFSLNTMTGTGSFASLNGTWVATTGTTGSTLNFTAPTGLTLTITGGNLGNVGVTMTTSAAHNLLPGDSFVIGSPVGTGFSQLAGTQIASAGTTGSTLNFVAASGLAPVTITSAAITTGGILPIRGVIATDIGRSMVVQLGTGNQAGTYQWNRTGSVAIIVL